MQWYHLVDEDWLKARHSVVTATELRDLRSAYKKATKAELAGTAINQTVAGLWAEKRSKKVDPGSSGAAARGHIMEPWAIEEFNERLGTEFVHYDDFLIRNGGMGFSPDAMDVPCENKGVLCDVGELVNKPRAILEIKSYQEKNHVKAILTQPKFLPERYQLAGAMLVCPTIEAAYICFYNPNCEIGFGWKRYTREDLEAEIDELRELYSWVLKQFAAIEKQASFWPETNVSEETIYSKWLEDWSMQAH